MVEEVLLQELQELVFNQEDGVGSVVKQGEREKILLCVLS